MAQALPGTGFDWSTGKIITGWNHTVQSLEIIFTTRFGERVMREWFGSLVPVLLGENMNVETILRTKVAIWSAIELFEPRFRIIQMRSLSVTRDGRYGLELAGQYRPRAHLGDFTVEGAKRVVMGSGNRDRAVTFQTIT